MREISSGVNSPGIELLDRALGNTPRFPVQSNDDRHIAHTVPCPADIGDRAGLFPADAVSLPCQDQKMDRVSHGVSESGTVVQYISRKHSIAFIVRFPNPGTLPLDVL
jgi:hypothetical protein